VSNDMQVVRCRAQLIELANCQVANLEVFLLPMNRNALACVLTNDLDIRV
jgi:hypothetical protein